MDSEPTLSRTLLDAPQIPDIDGELISEAGHDGQLQLAVIEHLRVRVPAAARLAWLEAERASWEPWLQRQQGFLGRELRWDAEHQEGQLLIRWASRELWHAIPRSEIEQVQERFERLAHAALERLGVVPPLQPQDGAGTAGQADPDDSPGPALGSIPASVAPGYIVATAPAPEATPRPANPFPLVYAGELRPDQIP